MGLGSYDECERETQRIATAIDAGNSRARPDHDGEVELEYEYASSDDLLEIFEEITGS